MAYARPERHIPDWFNLLSTDSLNKVTQRLTSASQKVSRPELQTVLYHCLMTTVPGCYGDEFNSCRFGTEEEVGNPGISVKPGDIEIRIKFEGVKATEAPTFKLKLSEIKLCAKFVNVDTLNRVIRAYYNQERGEAIEAARVTHQKLERETSLRVGNFLALRGNEALLDCSVSMVSKYAIYAGPLMLARYCTKFFGASLSCSTGPLEPANTWRSDEGTAGWQVVPFCSPPFSRPLTALRAVGRVMWCKMGVQTGTLPARNDPRDPGKQWAGWEERYAVVFPNQPLGLPARRMTLIEPEPD